MVKYTFEYIWLDGNLRLRSKTKVIDKHRNSSDIFLADLPIWNYDGSSTYQATGFDSEINIVPRKMVKDPFRRNLSSFLVLCDTYDKNMNPCKTNNRVNANSIFKKKLNEYPWYGLEQEYFLYDAKTNLPLGYKGGLTQGEFYCGVGADRSFGREIVEDHLERCIYSGLTISGINAEVAVGQWEFQIGPVEGIDAGDQLWLARYILERTAEKYNVVVNYDPKPLGSELGDWNGSGCHCNFSTLAMREGKIEKIEGLDVINEAVEKLKEKHLEHMLVYGENNQKRMSGLHETSDYNTFTCGYGNRGTSIRIPNDVLNNKKGYFEDRRPAANCDPYLVTSKIFETCCL